MKTHYLNPQGLYLLDAVSVVTAFVLSLYLRFESLAFLTDAVWILLTLNLIVSLVIYHLRHLYTAFWHHAGLDEVEAILMAGSLHTAVLIALNSLIFPLLNLNNIPTLTFFVIDWLLTLAFLIAPRLLLIRNRSHQNVDQTQLPDNNKTTKVVILGTTKLGVTFGRLLQEHPETNVELMGYLNSKPLLKQGCSIRGLPILGEWQDLPHIIKNYNVDELIVALPNVSDETLAEVYELCADTAVTIRVTPSMKSMMTGTLDLNQMRRWRVTTTPSVNGRKSQPITPDEQVYNNILITGGAGFIGANFVHYILETHPDYNVIVYDKLTYAGNLDNLLGLQEKYPTRYYFVKGDICDAQCVEQTIVAHEIDVIVNFAAESHVDRALLTPEKFFKTNTLGTQTLLEAGRKYNIKRFHQISTDEVYGQVLWGSFSEQDPLETRSPYSASKAAADLLLHSYSVSFGVPITITRGSNNIGPFQYPEKAVPLFVTNALEDKLLPVYGDGLYVRDYQYVRDHCRAIDVVLHRGQPGELYNVSSGYEMTTIVLARHILNRLGKPDSLICFVDDRVGQDRRYSLDCSKIMELGWRPEWTFEQSLDATIDWYVQNEWWWRKIKDGDFQAYYQKQFKQRLQQGEIYNQSSE